MKRKNTSRILAILLVIAMGLAMFAGCTKTEQPAAVEATEAPATDATATDAAAEETPAVVETDKSNWPQYLGLGSGGASSQTGIVGAIIAPALTEYLGINVSSETSGGTTANLLMVNDGTCELGLTGTDFAYEAWNGIATWTDETCQNFRCIVPLFPFIEQHYSSTASGINSIEALAGKTVNLSTAGSSTDTWMRRVIEVSGVDCKITNLAPSDANQQMSDKLIDASAVNGLAPHSAVSEFAATNATTVFGISDDIYGKLVEKYPYAGRYTIPAGTFEGQTEDIVTISTQCVLIGNKDMDEGLVYEMTKALFEHLADLVGQHKAFTYVSAEMVSSCTTPLHAGAARYYEEIGVEIPDNIKPID